MARRRKKSGGRKSKSLSITGMLPLYPAVIRFAKGGYAMADIPTIAVIELTGYDMNAKQFEMSRLKRQATFAVLSLVLPKIAAKTGVNKYMKKLTAGFLKV